MTLDPFEEQFHLPLTFVDIGNGIGADRKIVGQENKALVSLGIEESHSAQRFGIILFGLRPCQSNDLIALNASGFVYG